MIPKVIHCCWFGGKEKPKSAIKYMKSWEKYCPDYEIIEWNESNFDVSMNRYCAQAYEAKRYAFVTDFVRLYVMYNYGGVYMDTDVEVVKPLDDLLENAAFSGFEAPEFIPTGIMACEKGFPLFGELLSYYDSASFINPDGSFDTTTNTRIITDMVEARGLVKNGQMQTVEGFSLYPRDYFCPLDNATGKLHKTPNTYAIHWFAKSWVGDRVRLKSKITRPFHRIFGENCFDWLKKLLKKIKG